MKKNRVSAAATLLLSFCLASSVAATEKQASTGTEVVTALLDKDVTRIKITQSVNLDDSQLKSLTGDGANPIQISRNVELYADSTYVIFDFAFLAGQFIVAPGVTVQFTRLQLQRAEVGIPLGIFKSSPGATVKLQDCNNHLKVCAPITFSLAFFTTVARPNPLGGIQQASVDLSGVLHASDVVFNVPTTPSGLGGYTIIFAGTKLTCDATASLPVGSCLELPAAPSQDCNVAVRGAIKQMLCGASGCINS